MRYLYQERMNRLYVWSEEFSKRDDMREATQEEINRLLKINRVTEIAGEPVIIPYEESQDEESQDEKPIEPAKIQRTRRRRK